MNTNLFLIITVFILLLLGYGIKSWFQYQQLKGQESSNSTIKRAIGALMIGFLALAGIVPLISNVIIQLLNQLSGLELKASASNEWLGVALYLLLCMSITSLVYFYYAHRHKLYKQKKTKQPTLEVPTGTINHSKNTLFHSSIQAGRDVHIGDQKNRTTKKS